MKWILRSLILICLLFGGVAIAQPWHYNILWQREGLSDSSHYGQQIVSLGDQNNDGFADWAVFAWGNHPAGTPNENYVEFFHGDSQPAQVPYMVYRANPLIHTDLDSYFPGGDLNHDGFIDWVVVFRPIENYRICMNQIYFGGPDADTIPELVFRTSWDVFFEAIGDYNADGCDDLFAHDFHSNIYQIYYGGVVMDSIPDLNMPGVWEAEGDLNGDGFTDFEIGNFVDDTASFYYGGLVPELVARYSWPGFPYVNADIINDLNGDGKEELILVPVNLQSLNVHFGREGDMSRTPDFVLNYAMGFRCFSLGDINDDGYNDFVAMHQNGENFAVFLGHPWLNLNPALTVSIRTGPLFLPGIAWVAGLGDINGDGVDDMGIGSTSGDTDGQRGRALILSGDSTYHVPVSEPFTPQPLSFNVSVFPNPFNASATIALDVPWGVQKVTLRLINVLGQTVQSYEKDVTPGAVSIPIDGASLSTGIYFLQVQANTIRSTTKLVVLR